MESKNKDLTSLLATLASLHQQRRDGYEKAIIECQGNFPELRILFAEFADESRSYISTLQEKLQHLDAALSSPVADGEISRIWNDVKWAYTGINKDGILQSAHDAEEVIQLAYSKALEDEAEMSAETRQMLIEQKEALEMDASRINSIIRGSELVVK
jgi:uncharacterized protein (TIGR02284 family)